MAPLTAKELKAMQKQAWGQAGAEPARLTNPATVGSPKTTTKRTHPYLNIIRKDIVCLRNALSITLNPIRWCILCIRGETQEYRDFMDQYFPKKGNT
jgi:hypothetical protein